VEFGEISPLMRKVVSATAQRLAILLGGELGDGSNDGWMAMNANAADLVLAGGKAPAAKSELGTT
jgi:hypothetical protein